jgi:hypothetical protein
MKIFKREQTYREYINQDPDYIKALRKILKKMRYSKRLIEFELGNCRYHLECTDETMYRFGGKNGWPLFEVSTTIIVVDHTLKWEKD